MIKLLKYYILLGRFNWGGYMTISMCDFNMDITYHHYLTSKVISENFLKNWNRGCNKCQICRNKPKKCSKIVSFLVKGVILIFLISICFLRIYIIV